MYVANGHAVMTYSGQLQMGVFVKRMQMQDIYQVGSGDGSESSLTHACSPLETFGVNYARVHVHVDVWRSVLCRKTMLSHHAS